MPTTSYNAKITNRGEAARGILANEAAKQAAAKGGVPVEQLEAISKNEQAAKAADQDQRQKQTLAKSRQTVFDEAYAKIQREYTNFRQRRESRKLELQGPVHQALHAVLLTEYARKVQVERVSKKGETVISMEESKAAADRLAEISSAVSAVLAHKELIKLFAQVEYGQELLQALQQEAERLLVEQKAIEVIRKEAEVATQQEHAAVATVKELWKVYGPQLRRAGEKNSTIKAFLTNT
jgi:hypothetical protein